MLDIPVLDIHEKIFKKHSDPLSLFPFRKKVIITRKVTIWYQRSLKIFKFIN